MLVFRKILRTYLMDDPKYASVKQPSSGDLMETPVKM